MIPGERGFRLADMAQHLGVSATFLRGSDCPCHRKRGNGPKGKPVVIYYLSEVEPWWAEREVDVTWKAAS